jgi:hypothetical protein
MGVVGYRKIGNFSNIAYTNNRKLLYGLLALNVPVTIMGYCFENYVGDAKMGNYTKLKNYQL